MVRTRPIGSLQHRSRAAWGPCGHRPHGSSWLSRTWYPPITQGEFFWRKPVPCVALPVALFVLSTTEAHCFCDGIDFNLPSYFTNIELPFLTSELSACRSILWYRNRQVVGRWVRVRGTWVCSGSSKKTKNKKSTVQPSVLTQLESRLPPLRTLAWLFPPNWVCQEACTFA